MHNMPQAQMFSRTHGSVWRQASTIQVQMLSDKILGWTFIGLPSSFIAFYTIWVVFLPFVDEEQVIHRYFPDKYYAVALPLLAGVIGLALIGGFVLYSLKTSDNSDSLVLDEPSSTGSKKQL